MLLASCSGKDLVGLCELTGTTEQNIVDNFKLLVAVANFCSFSTNEAVKLNLYGLCSDFDGLSPVLNNQ